ncbi:TPR domain-containing protein [Leptodontidium sp. 2 PMI_412]|nr:TPR domain-containing protein [Leptodontidium sp. 2 PMI_412]
MASTAQRHTVFLTPQEDDRVRKTLKSRLQKCEEFAGQPRMSGDSKSRLSQLIGASLMSDFSDMAGEEEEEGANKDAMSAFAVGQPYPPCTPSLRDLEPMKLSDLRLHTHHRGRVLSVKRNVAVLNLNATSWTVVEDALGETERLEILLHKSTHGQDILESGSTYKIKEPYFTFNDEGEPTLRVDHPSDLVVSSENHFDTDIPNPSTTEAEKTAKQYKEEGNAALKQKDPLQAHASYSQGLRVATVDGATKEDLAYDLYRNRAHVNLTLERFDEAKADALRALLDREDQKELDSKAYYRAGSAAYGLGAYQEAKEYFEKQLMLMPGEKLAVSSLSRAEARLREQATGVYNFKKIKAGLSTACLGVDAASFTSNVKVGESGGRGRGLYSTRAIDEGEIVLCEKSFRVVWGHHREALTAMTYDGRDEKIRVIPAGLNKAIVEKLRDNPSQIQRVMDLYGDYRSAVGKQLVVTDESTPVIDTFQIHDIVARNAFGPGQASPRRGIDISSGSAGLWILAAYINHSCTPNAKKEFIGDLMVLRATRKIAVGEEISHSYDESTDHDSRATALMTTWGFQCTCALCIAQRADSPTVREKRRELESETHSFVQSHSPVGAKRITIVQARRLARAIGDTYDDERYNNLPRTALSEIQKWLPGDHSRF